MTDIDPADVPGYTEAIMAVNQLQDSFELTAVLEQVDIGKIVVAVMLVTRPYVQAEVLADMSDLLATTGQEALAVLLDNVSGGMRKALR